MSSPRRVTDHRREGAIQMPSTRRDDVLEAARFDTLRAALVDLTPA